jgi:uncharacterized protein (TIGR01777 family)
MRVGITGASGFIGSALVRSLTEGGHRAEGLKRGEPPPDGLDGVVNLAGEPIVPPWTAAKREKIRTSRIDGTKRLCQALIDRPQRPRVLVSASAVGFYGDRSEDDVDEDCPPGTGFLAEVARDWEAATQAASDAGIRVVRVRVGIVLGPDGGLLKKVLPLYRMGMGGKQGSGRQWISWVDLHDLVAILTLGLTDDSLSGAVNGVAPNPARNADFAATLGRVLSRPAIMAAPAFALRMLLGPECAHDLVLGGQKVRPKRLIEKGFPFGSPDLEPALRRMLGR